jgi:hypothetical protein
VEKLTCDKLAGFLIQRPIQQSVRALVKRRIYADLFITILILHPFKNLRVEFFRLIAAAHVFTGRFLPVDIEQYGAQLPGQN